MGPYMGLTKAFRTCCNYPAIAVRSFATSTTNSSAFKPAFLPIFPPTSSPDLDTAIERIRDRLIIPRHLSWSQRRLARDPAKKERLEREEIIVRIGDVSHRIRHVDDTNRPSQLEAIQAAVALTKANDWQIWASLLQALDSAGLKLRNSTKAELVRRASSAGQHDVVFALLKEKWSGLSFEQTEIRDLVFNAARESAEEAGWELEATKEALRRAEKLQVFMQTPGHVGEQPVASLLTAAVPLELCWRLHIASQAKTTENQAQGEADVNVNEPLAFNPKTYLEKAQAIAKRLVAFSDFQKLLELDNDSEELVNPLVSSLGLPLRACGFLTVCTGLRVAENVLVDDIDKAAVHKVLSRVEHYFQNGKMPGLADKWQRYQGEGI